jgi:hypothetical protein
VRDLLRHRIGEAVVVARSGWRGVVHRVDPAAARFTQLLVEGAVLADALDRAGEGLDFAAWLADALRHGWLQGLALAAD